MVWGRIIFLSLGWGIRYSFSADRDRWTPSRRWSPSGVLVTCEKSQITKNKFQINFNTEISNSKLYVLIAGILDLESVKKLVIEYWNLELGNWNLIKKVMLKMMKPSQNKLLDFRIKFDYF